jgi:hypothetical protein
MEEKHVVPSTGCLSYIFPHLLIRSQQGWYRTGTRGSDRKKTVVAVSLKGRRHEIISLFLFEGNYSLLRPGLKILELFRE